MLGVNAHPLAQRAHVEDDDVVVRIPCIVIDTKNKERGLLHKTVALHCNNGTYCQVGTYLGTYTQRIVVGGDYSAALQRSTLSSTRPPQGTAARTGYPIDDLAVDPQ